MVSGNADRVELRHMSRSVAHDVLNYPGRGEQRIYISISNHKLLQNIVLYGAREKVFGNSLTLGGDDVTSKNREHCAIHCHRHRHLIERYIYEEGQIKQLLDDKWHIECVIIERKEFLGIN